MHLASENLEGLEYDQSVSCAVSPRISEVHPNKCDPLFLVYGDDALGEIRMRDDSLRFDVLASGDILGGSRAHRSVAGIRAPGVGWRAPRRSAAATAAASGPDIFGIEKYLPEGTAVHYARLRDFEGRGQAIQTVLDYAEQNKMRRQVRSAIGQVCEELLMNALYDAPVDADGKQIFAEIDPHDRTKTKSPRPVSIRYAATEDRFAVAVRDRFGRLAKNTILAYIEKCIHSPNQIDRKTYGAGLGLYLVANAAASYVVNVAYGIATEVVCTFDRGAKTPLRLVGVFVHPGGADMLKGPTPDSIEQELPRGAPGG
jgi:hypothetical protein